MTQRLPRGGLKELGLHKHHPFYMAWTNMKTRCDNPKSTQYKWYGGRGIKYCPDWQSFMVFFLDMFPTWRQGLILDRENGDEPYFKENCRWVSAEESCRNRSTTKLNHEDYAQIRRLYEAGTHTQAELARHFGVTQGYIWHLLDAADLI